MTKQEQFFYDNAGYSVAQGETQEQGKTRSAKALALAETWAAQEGMVYETSADPDADESWMDNETQEYKDEWSGNAWCVALWNANETKVLASLGACYGDSAYKRVVRAELAFEAMPEDVRKVA